MRLALSTVACLFAGAVIALLSWPATGEQLLVNPGFEAGTTEGWASIDADIYPSNAARNGQWSLEMTSTGQESFPEVFQWVQVQTGSPYEFFGWVRLSDPNVERVFLRLTWVGASDQFISTEVSEWLVGSAPEFRYLTSGSRQAPPGAVRARASVTAASLGPMTIHLDDFSLVGPDATPTLPPAPTQQTTPAPSASATPTGIPSPTETASSTATQAPAPTDPAAPTATPPPTPGNTTGSATATPARTRTPTPPASPAPTAIPTRPPEPGVFTSLTNGGFEDVREDGTPYGWRKIGGTMSSRSQYSHSGSRALELASNGTSSTKWVYQTLAVSGGSYYSASLFARHNDPALAAAFLRVSWYDSFDGSGEAIRSEDSTTVLESLETSFRELSTGPIQAPATAQTAKIRLMIRPGPDGNGSAFFDDVAFFAVASPTEEPTSVPTVSAPPSTPQRTPAPGTQPATPTPSARAIPPTAQPTAPPTEMPTPMPEPAFFEVLTNGGFEIVREDETPYGWHKNGGAMTASDNHSKEGHLSLAIHSASESTKWAHQAVRVQAGASYEASAWVLNPGAEVEVRLSWYSSDDGSGEAMKTVQSDALPAPTGSFIYVTTGPAEAPDGAHSAKVRLLVRPANADAVTVFFDAASLVTADRGAAAESLENAGAAARVVAGAQSRPFATTTGAGDGAQNADGPASEGLTSVANVRRAEAAEEEGSSIRPADSGVSGRDLFIALLIGVPLAGIGLVAANDFARWRRD